MNDLCPICSSTIESGFTSCPSCGFKLSGATEKFTPISMPDQNSASQPKRSAQVAILKILRGGQIQALYKLQGKEVSIGRSPECSIFLNDMTVSRRHAKISRLESGYVIEDLNSYNGVWVNNKNIERMLLVQGDLIQIGSFVLLFEEE